MDLEWRVPNKSHHGDRTCLIAGPLGRYTLEIDSDGFACLCEHEGNGSMLFMKKCDSVAAAKAYLAGVLISSSALFTQLCREHPTRSVRVLRPVYYPPGGGRKG